MVAVFLGLSGKRGRERDPFFKKAPSFLQPRTTLTLRVKHEEKSSIEAALFKAFPKDTVGLTHVSRGSLTGPGDHAAKQLISLTFVGKSVPTPEMLNASLPEDIRVFKICKVSCALLISLSLSLFIAPNSDFLHTQGGERFFG